MNQAEATARLCLSCGLCCNGVLFSDVELQPGDDPSRLAGAGLRLSTSRGKDKLRRFPQPCAALCNDNRCQIYTDRPARCREFECGILKDVMAERLEVDAALRLIRRARQQVERVLDLLRRLGDAAEHLPLSTRFRRARRRFEAGTATSEAVELLGELTLAVHRLNVLTHERFYAREVAGASKGTPVRQARSSTVSRTTMPR